MRRRIKRNIPLLLVTNPCHKVRRNRERLISRNRERVVDLDEFLDNIEDEQRDALEKAINKYIEFHGCEPSEIILKDIPIGDEDEIEFFVGMGLAPAESYDARDIEGSSKADAVYVHEYGEEDGEKPLKVMSSDGRLVLTLPGKWRIDDWMRG